MSNDNMRYNLVTQFVCAQCGTTLAMSYTAPKAAYDSSTEDHITGAAKVEQRLAIHPCRKCYGEAIAPLEALRSALKAIAPNDA